MLKDKIIKLSLDAKCFNAKDLSNGIIEKLKEQGRECYIKSDGALPVINIDGYDYNSQIIGSVGAFVGEQQVILTRR